MQHKNQVFRGNIAGCIFYKWASPHSAEGGVKMGDARLQRRQGIGEPFSFRVVQMQINRFFTGSGDG